MFFLKLFLCYASFLIFSSLCTSLHHTLSIAILLHMCCSELLPICCSELLPICCSELLPMCCSELLPICRVTTYNESVFFAVFEALLFD